MMQQIENLLSEMDFLMLPATLEDCFEAYRELLLQGACEPISEEVLFSFTTALKTVYVERDKKIALSDIFDPLLGYCHHASRLPVGNEITIPPVPSSILKCASANSEFAKLCSREAERLASAFESYDEDAISSLFAIASAGYVDNAPPPTNRLKKVSYIAVNGSSRVRDFLMANETVLCSVPQRRIVFQDTVKSRREMLLEYIPDQAAIFEINPRTPEYFLECYSDDEIKAITLDVRSLALSPRIRHLGVCRRCLTRLLSWQNQLATFQRIASTGNKLGIDA